MMRWLRDWLDARAFQRQYAEIERHDFTSLKEDLKLAITLIESAEGQTEDGNHCSASNFYAEAIHLLRSAMGQRVYPSAYEHYGRQIPLRYAYKEGNKP